MITADISGIWCVADMDGLSAMEPLLSSAQDDLQQAGGLTRLPVRIRELQTAAEHIREICDTVLILGNTGAEAVCPLLEKQNGPKLIFLHGSYSTAGCEDLIARLRGRDLCVVAAGTLSVAETVQLLYIRKLLRERYGVRAESRIWYLTQQMPVGAVPENVLPVPGDGSDPMNIFTAALLPLALAGAAPESFLDGARDAQSLTAEHGFENPAWLFAGARLLLKRSGRISEQLLTDQAAADPFGRWYALLSETGYAGTLHTACRILPRDRIPEPSPDSFYTMLRFAPSAHRGAIPGGSGRDGIAGKSPESIGYCAGDQLLGELSASDAPVIFLESGIADAAGLGELCRFLQISCALTRAVMSAPKPVFTLHESLERHLRKKLQSSST